MGNTAIEAFRPVTFLDRNYPYSVFEEAELVRSVDTMHELRGINYFTSDSFFSVDEAKLIRETSDQVVELTTQRFGRPIRPWTALLGAIPLFRAICALEQFSGKRSLSVFEVGPGSGYLPSLLIQTGHTYASVDSTQAFYLWQNRLFEWLAPGELTELGSIGVSALATRTRIVHVPWWEYCNFFENVPLTADIVVCEAVLKELSTSGLKYVLRMSREMLAGPGMKLLLFSDTFGTVVSNHGSGEWEPTPDLALTLAQDFFSLERLHPSAVCEIAASRCFVALRDPSRRLHSDRFSAYARW